MDRRNREDGYDDVLMTLRPSEERILRGLMLRVDLEPDQDVLTYAPTEAQREEIYKVMNKCFSYLEQAYERESREIEINGRTIEI